MTRRIQLALIVALVCTVAPAMMPSGIERAAAASGVLYTWKIPASGHRGAWTFARGVATYTGESNTALYAPYKLKHVANFAIQATLRGLGPGGPQANLIGFGLAVRQQPADPHTSISGGSFFSSWSEENNPGIYWNRATVGGAAFDPGTSWHVYRLEVHGDEYTLLIDGHKMVDYTIDDYPYPTEVGVFSTYYRVDVKSFQVFALSALAQSVARFPLLRAYSLTVSDLPTNTFYNPDLRHFYPNDEIARERNVSLASVEASGRIVSYGQDFAGNDGSDVYSTVTAFDTPADARKDITTRLNSIAQSYSSNPNYKQLPPNQVGEVSAGASFDVSGGGYTFNFLLLYFQRGRYDGQVEVLAVPGTYTVDQLVARAATLGKIIDKRLQQASY